MTNSPCPELLQVRQCQWSRAKFRRTAAFRRAEIAFERLYTSLDVAG
ncbi:hypothetical protein H6G27_14750 [Nostoc linckia FACHB-104]|nr:hypothetical protein [Nostoc linckia FACHB-104]